MLRLAVMAFLFVMSSAASEDSTRKEETKAKTMPYAMYVWNTGWDPTLSGCDVEKFYGWKDFPECFTHTWDTANHRSWLWNTCQRSGREVRLIFLSETAHILKTRDCTANGIQTIKDTLREGHQLGIKIYALFAASDVNVSERNNIRDLVWYNENCAAAEEERFDGAAVNNEAFNPGWAESEITKFLDRLHELVELAAPLPVHFSVSWRWGVTVSWNGKKQSSHKHFIDIFSSTDVQTAFCTAEAMSQRLTNAEYQYALSLGKQIFNTAYSNKAEPCQITFFPFENDPSKCAAAWSHAYKSEDRMWEELDKVENHIPGVATCIHYFRGAYSSGGHPDWPSHGLKK